jgi:hypothetical protein
MADPRAQPPTTGSSWRPDLTAETTSTIWARRGMLTTASRRTKPVRNVLLERYLSEHLQIAARGREPYMKPDNMTRSFIKRNGK